MGTTRGHVFAILCGLVATSACSFREVIPPVTAPPWERAALGTREADVTVAVDLQRLRADPLLGPIVLQLARSLELGVLARASQIDVAMMTDGSRPTSWIAVAHGVDGPPREHEVGSTVGQPRRLSPWALEYRDSSVGNLIAVPDEWIFGEGAPIERVRANIPAPVSRMILPPRAVMVSTSRASAFQCKDCGPFLPVAEGLREVAIELLTGERLELLVAARYTDGASARRAATTARLGLTLAAGRTDLASEAAHALLTVDFDVSADVVTSRIVLNDDLRQLLQRYVALASR